jgi:plasmid stabilization system protein ParE
MTKPRFQLTRRAALDLRNIYDHSREQWGEKVARAYIDALYTAMHSLKADDNRANQRKQRSLPFSLVPAGKHFVVYEIINNIPVVITLLHQRRNIETIIHDFTPDFLSEIATLRKAINKRS